MNLLDNVRGVRARTLDLHSQLQRRTREAAEYRLLLVEPLHLATKRGVVFNLRRIVSNVSSNPTDVET